MAIIVRSKVPRELSGDHKRRALKALAEGRRPNPTTLAALFTLLVERGVEHPKRLAGQILRDDEALKELLALDNLPKERGLTNSPRIAELAIVKLRPNTGRGGGGRGRQKLA